MKKITYLFIAAAFLAGYNGPGAWKIFWRDRYNHLSPNSAMTESVTAGALNIQLGGDHYYFGKMVHKDTIGDDIRPVEPEDIIRVNKMLYITSVLCLIIFTGIRYITFTL